MVPRDLNIGFQGLALIQGQIYNPETLHLPLNVTSNIHELQQDISASHFLLLMAEIRRSPVQVGS